MSDPVGPRVLVLFPGALGDFICFLPALQALARKAQVDVLAQTAFADLTPARIRVRSLECYEIRRLFAAGAAEDKRCVEFFGSYTSIYSWTGNGQDHFVRSLDGLSRGRARVYPFRCADGRTHQMDYYLSCLGTALENPDAPLIAPRREAMDWSEKYWAQNGLENRLVLALAPGSGANEKNWPVAFYQAVASWWRRKTGGAVVVILGPVEEERGAWNFLCTGNLVARKLSLAQVVALLSRSRLYLGNDSGVTHVAAALGIRTVALFGPSDVRQWAPRGKKVTIVTQNVECSPCARRIMKSCTHRKCLTTLAPEQIIRILKQLPERATLTRGGQEFRLNSAIFPLKHLKSD
jgi:ADP-heptose:LPS heptosyltransferase